MPFFRVGVVGVRYSVCSTEWVPKKKGGFEAQNHYQNLKIVAVCIKTRWQSIKQGAMNTESGLAIQIRAKKRVLYSVQSKIQWLKIEHDPKQLRNDTFFEA